MVKLLQHLSGGKEEKSMQQACAALRIVGTSAFVLGLSLPVHADPAYIYGIHDAGGESLMGSNKGWLVFTEAIGTSGSGGVNYSTWSSQGYGVVVRLNNGYGSSGTLPFQSQYGAFASRCASFVAGSSGVDYWIIGNECNLPREWPGNLNGDPNTGEPITSARYINCYNQCWAAIKAAAPAARVCPAPSGTWSPPWPAQGIEEFVDYWVNCLNGVGASSVDGLILHAYTHGCDPALVTSNQKMGPPYEDINYHFRVYQNYMTAIPASMTATPVLITECDQNVECADNSTPRRAWQDANNGWVRAVYAEIDAWNDANTQKIRCVALFRWPMAPEGEYTFGFSALTQVQADFQQAVAFGYQWGAPGSNCAGLGSGNPPGNNLSTSAAYSIESGRFNQSQYGRYALDGQAGTKWCCDVSQSGGSASLAVDLGRTCTVNGYIVRHAQWGGEASYLNTKLYRVESSTSIFGPWTTEWDVDNTCQDQYNRFTHGTPKSLRYVRLFITNPGIDSYVRLPELEVYGTLGAVEEVVTVHVADYRGGVNAQNGVDYSDTTAGNSGGAYRSHDVDIETSTDGRYNVGWIAAGEWWSFPIQGDGGPYALSLRYASPYSASGHFTLDGAAFGPSVSLPATGGWQMWSSVLAGNVNLASGWHTITFVADASSFNVHRFWLDPNLNGMIDSPPGGSNLAPGSTQVATDTNFDANSTGAKAIDGVVSAGSKWTSTAASSTHWLKLDLGASRTVNGFVVRHAGAGGEPTYYNTQQLKLQSGTSYTGPWTDEAVVDNTAQASVTNRSYLTPKALRYVRLYITDAGIDNYARIPEFEVWGVAGGGPLAVTEDFNSMPSWSSSFDAAWGSAATWSIAGGGQSGNALQASRGSQGSSAKVKVYGITANTSYTLSVYIKCPSYSGAYWAECAYKLGSATAQDFDTNGASWTMVKKFANTGPNGNGNVWTQYTAAFNSGSSTQISVGFKLGSSGGAGPTVLWDTFRVQ